MKNFHICILFVLGFIGSTELYAQGKFNLELYGGGNQSFFEAEKLTTDPSATIQSPLDFHLGVNFLTRMAARWQLSVQAEWLRVPFSENYPEGSGFGKSIIGEEYGVYALGARYNWDKGEYGFFIQPSIGVATNRYFDTHQGAQSAENQKLALSPVFRTEAGIKLYNKRNNYFVFGVRQQFGVSNLYREKWEGSNFNVNNRGSYLGLFMGYGINFDNWSKRKHIQ
ncbi:hypothetical protein [Cecembia calidifontis]|uniref:Outer membrane protein with beta-barrel domain n=1 Tax=Cecembia calidifontis TaxID=1187080 RepID=A0A4Q7P7R4_9BACT|nr:hypothetical protein [Cecembia calidifontis]RZS96196.1 hypothetical protein BC751_1762 [Cecembia calidifontis]